MADNTPPVIPLLTLSVLPLKNTVLFPTMFMPLSVGRPASLAAVEAGLNTEEKTFFVTAQKDGSLENPGPQDLFPIGTRAVVKRMARGENTIELLVQGLERVRFLHWT